MPLSLCMNRSDALESAHRLVDERFPDALAAFLGGSALTAQRTATSDLDIVVVLDGPPAPYRETLRAHGWLVELFVHTAASMRHYWHRDAAARRTPLLRMCAEGRVLREVGTTGDDLQAEARQRLSSPPAPDPAELARRRYLVTSLLDDLEDASAPAELSYLAGALLESASELALAAGGRWLGSGKWLPRRLAEYDADLAQLAEGYRVDGELPGGSAKSH